MSEQNRCEKTNIGHKDTINTCLSRPLRRNDRGPVLKMAPQGVLRRGNYNNRYFGTCVEVEKTHIRDFGEEPLGGC